MLTKKDAWTVLVACFVFTYIVALILRFCVVFVPPDYGTGLVYTDYINNELEQRVISQQAKILSLNAELEKLKATHQTTYVKLKEAYTKYVTMVNESCRARVQKAKDNKNSEVKPEIEPVKYYVYKYKLFSYTGRKKGSGVEFYSHNNPPDGTYNTNATTTRTVNVTVSQDPEVEMIKLLKKEGLNDINVAVLLSINTLVK